MALKFLDTSLINRGVNELEVKPENLHNCDLNEVRLRLLRIETKIKIADTSDDDSKQTNPETPTTFCELFEHFATQSTLHGLSNIATSKRNWIKVFWIVLLIAGTGMAVWQTVDIFTEYFRYPVLTITELHKGGVILPQVTVCNNNGFLKSKVLEDPKIKDVIDERLKEDNAYMRFLISLLPEEDRIRLSHNISDYVIRSYGNSSVLSFTQLPTMLGNCYEFVQLVHKQEYPHVILIANFNFNEYFKESGKPGGLAFLLEKGLYPHIYSEPYIELEAGYRSFVYLKMETIIRKNRNYGKCQDAEEEFFEETGIPYSEDVCKAICVSKRILGECGCIIHLFDSFPSRFKISNVFTNTSDCSGDKNECYRNKSDLIRDDSTCDCKPRCHMTRYIITDHKKYEITDSDWLCEYWDECSKKSNKTERNEWVMKNVAFLNIQFSDTEHKEYRQVPGYPLSRFLSDIGGTLGLYMGVSLLTLAEIPQTIIGSVIFCTKRVFQRKIN